MSRLAARAALAAGAAAVLALGAAAWYAFRPAPEGDVFAQCRTTVVAAGGGAIGGPFELTDQTGARVTDAQVIDGPTLIYFGYTWCPDVCPFDVARMAEATEILEDRGVMVKPVFVTVDPARDTPETLAGFAAAHHPRMTALTGTEAEIDAAKRAFRVYAARSQGGDEEFYLVDHSTFTYLMAPGHGFLDVLRRELTSEQLADRVQCFVERL